MIPSLQVKLAAHSYPIHFCSDVVSSLKFELAELAARQRRCALLTDRGVALAAGALLKRVFTGVPRLILAAGESSKSLESYGHVLDFLANERLDRDSVLWVAGGGVMGDLGGFAAATYLRGIACVHVPTTLLAMVDSSVGGKTGLNLPAGKNLVGAFHQPLAVFVSVDLLATLPSREFAAGVGEIVKYGMLGDAFLFGQLERATLTPTATGLLEVVRRCCAMKAGIVGPDERETASEGGRALLNLGHTFGHAIEQATGYADYLHGEAVAIGLVGAARLSEKLGYLKSGDVVRVENVLVRHALPIRLRAPLAVSALSEAMKHDKKARAGGLRFVVLTKIGEARTCSDVDPSLVATVWRELGATD